MSFIMSSCPSTKLLMFGKQIRSPRPKKIAATSWMCLNWNYCQDMMEERVLSAACEQAYSNSWFFCWFFGNLFSKFCRDVNWHTEKLLWPIISRYFFLEIHLCILLHDICILIWKHVVEGMWLFIRKITTSPLFHISCFHSVKICILF